MEYAPDAVAVVFLGKTVSGFHDGTFASAVRTVDMADAHVGADGKGTVVYNADKSGIFTITLAQSSPSNKEFSIAAAARLSGPMTMKDTNGSSISFGATTFVSALPTIDNAQDLSPRVWVFKTLKLDIFEGGNA